MWTAHRQVRADCAGDTSSRSIRAAKFHTRPRQMTSSVYIRQMSMHLDDIRTMYACAGRRAIRSALKCVDRRPSVELADHQRSPCLSDATGAAWRQPQRRGSVGVCGCRGRLAVGDPVQAWVRMSSRTVVVPRARTLCVASKSTTAHAGSLRNRSATITNGECCTHSGSAASVGARRHLLVRPGQRRPLHQRAQRLGRASGAKNGNGSTASPVRPEPVPDSCCDGLGAVVEGSTEGRRLRRRRATASQRAVDRLKADPPDRKLRSGGVEPSCASRRSAAGPGPGARPSRWPGRGGSIAGWPGRCSPP